MSLSRIGVVSAPDRLTFYDALNAIQNGDIEILNSLKFHKKDAFSFYFNDLLSLTTYYNILISSAFVHDVAIFDWFLDQCPSYQEFELFTHMGISKTDKSLLVEAACKNRTDILDWISKRLSKWPESEKYHRDFLGIIKEAFLAAAENGHVEVLSWFKNNFNAPTIQSMIAISFEDGVFPVFNRAVMNDHAKVLTWLKENADPAVLLKMMDSCFLDTTYPRLQIGGFPRSYKLPLYICAIQQQNINVLNWFAVNFPDHCKKMIYSSSFKNAIGDKDSDRIILGLKTDPTKEIKELKESCPALFWLAATSSHARLNQLRGDPFIYTFINALIKVDKSFFISSRNEGASQNTSALFRNRTPAVQQPGITNIASNSNKAAFKSNSNH